MPDLLREIAADSEDPFYVVDLGTVMSKIIKWRELMPRVSLFYAIKCNNDPAICQLLATAGCGFDCASQAEIQQVRATAESAQQSACACVNAALI